MNKIILIVFIVMNIIAFAAYGIDKLKAIKGKWRIPEATLLTLTIMGGSVGSFLAMKTFHHKTRKMKFIIIVSVSMIAHILLLIYLNN